MRCPPGKCCSSEGGGGDELGLADSRALLLREPTLRSQVNHTIALKSLQTSPTNQLEQLQCIDAMATQRQVTMLDATPSAVHILLVEEYRLGKVQAEKPGCGDLWWWPWPLCHLGGQSGI